MSVRSKATQRRWRPGRHRRAGGARAGAGLRGSGPCGYCEQDIWATVWSGRGASLSALLTSYRGTSLSVGDPRRSRRPRHRPLRGAADDHRAGYAAGLTSRWFPRAATSSISRSRTSSCCSRYGSETEGVQLDKLGGVSLAVPQGAAEAAAERNRLRADQDRSHCAAEGSAGLAPPPGAYEEFVARFPTRRPRISSPARGGRGGSELRPADGPACLRRRRLRQDGGSRSGRPT